MDLPGALALTWGLVGSELPEQAKLSLLLEFDRIFGLDLASVPAAYELPETVTDAVERRVVLREKTEYVPADEIRADVLSQGYLVQDISKQARIRPKTPLEKRLERWPSVSSSREVESFLHRPAEYDFTFILNAYGYADDVERCLRSMVRYSEGHTTEIIVIDNGSTDGTAEWLEGFQASHPSMRVIHCDHNLGDAAGKNIGLKQSLGANIIILDGSAEIADGILDSIAQQLADPTVGIFGPLRAHHRRSAALP